MLELVIEMLKYKDATDIFTILVNGGTDTLEAAQVITKALTKQLGLPIQMKSIEIIWHEGTGQSDGYSTDNWHEFNMVLEKIARQHGDDCGYSKTKFQLTWQDGEIYEGRLDVNTKDDKNVGQHMMDFLEFHTGDHCPSHMTEADYENLLISVGGEKGKREAREYLARYDIVI